MVAWFLQYQRHDHVVDIDRKNWQQSNTRNIVNLGKLEIHWRGDCKSMRSEERHSHTHTKIHNCTIVAHAKRLVAISRLYTRLRHILELELARAREISWLAAVDGMRNNNSFSILPISQLRPRLVGHLVFHLSRSVSLITLKWWNDIGLKRSLISFRRSKRYGSKFNKVAAKCSHTHKEWLSKRAKEELRHHDTRHQHQGINRKQKKTPMNYQSGGTWTRNAEQTYDKTKLIVIKLVSTEHSMRFRFVVGATPLPFASFPSSIRSVALRESAWSTICYFDDFFSFLFHFVVAAQRAHVMKTPTKWTEMYRLWMRPQSHFIPQIFRLISRMLHRRSNGWSSATKLNLVLVSARCLFNENSFS